MAGASLTRRTLVKTLSASLALKALPQAGLSQDAGPVPFVLILQDLPADLEPGRVSDLFRPLKAALVRVGIAVPAMADADRLNPGLAEELLALARDNPGMVELLPETGRDRPEFDTPFALARGLGEDLARFVGQFPATAELDPVTLFAKGTGPGWPTGLRAVGLRSLFEAGIASAAPVIGAWADNTRSIAGGLHWRLSDDPAKWRRDIGAVLDAQPLGVAFLSLGWANLLLSGRIERLGATLAEAIDGHRRAGRLASLLPREYAFRALGTDFDQSVLILLDDRLSGAGTAAFAAGLLDAGIAFGRIAGPGAGALGLTAAETVVLAADDLPEGRHVSCQFQAGGAATAGSGVVTFTAAEGRSRGLSADAGLTVPLAAVVGTAAAGAAHFDGFASPRGSMRDQAILIRPDAVDSPAARGLLLDAIIRLARSGRVRFKSVGGFVFTVFREVALVDHLRRSEVNLARSELARPPAASAPDAMTSLEADARIAWGFFEYGLNERSGLSVPLEFRSQFFHSKYERITLWDVASNLLGILAAIELGLLDRATGVDRLARILRTIPSRKVNGLTLPVAEFHYATGAPLSTEFNACDTGRLLVALKAVVEQTGLGPLAAETVAGWEIAATLDDRGWPRSASRAGWVTAADSHCSDYLARGYRFWGIEAVPLHPETWAEDRADDHLRLLAQAVDLGPLGYEPHALSVVEYGGEPASGLLLDVLLGAQVESYLESGALVAPSETPLNRVPWFTFQGLSLEDPTRRWEVRSMNPDPAFAAPEMQDELLVMSAKACYLAAAVRPSAFAERLRDDARRSCAAPETGFCAGKFVQSGEPMTEYRDVNTNGIILEALAYMARGRRPWIGA